MNKCLCPKPEGFYRIAKEGEPVHKLGFVHDLTFEPLDDCLHFRQATTRCVRCWQPLCTDCWVCVDREVESAFYKGLMVLVVDVLCPTCAEYLEGK